MNIYFGLVHANLYVTSHLIFSQSCEVAVTYPVLLKGKWNHVEYFVQVTRESWNQVKFTSEIMSFLL